MRQQGMIAQPLQLATAGGQYDLKLNVVDTPKGSHQRAQDGRVPHWLLNMGSWDCGMEWTAGIERKAAGPDAMGRQ